MANALRQLKLGGNGSGGSSATSSAVGFSSNTLANSLLVCIVWATGSAAANTGALGIGVPSTSGFTWTLAKQPLTAWSDASSFNKGNCAIYYIANAGVMASTVTTTVAATKAGTSPNVQVEFELLEITGAATSSPLETSSSAKDETGSNTPINPGSLTTAVTDFIISAYQCEATSNQAANTGAGYTITDNSTYAPTGQAQYIANKAAGTIVTSWPTAEAFWAACSVAFKAAAVAPVVTGCTPGGGSTSGSTAVTITGTNFISGATVSIGGVSCSAVVVSSSTVIFCTTGARASGVCDVVVTTSGGVGTGVGLYTYNPAPNPTGVSPAAGPLAGGSPLLTITGTNFLA